MRKFCDGKGNEWREMQGRVKSSQKGDVWLCEGYCRVSNAPGCRVGWTVSGERSGNIGKRLVDHRLGRFHGSGYACHQKRRSGKASDEPEIDSICPFLPWDHQKKRYEDIKLLENGKGPVDRVRERRKGDGGRNINTEFILERGGDQRSFKLRPCGAKIATGDNRFQNGLRRIVTLCAFPPSLPLHRTHLPSLSLTFPATVARFFLHYIVRFPFISSLRWFYGSWP